MTSWLPQQSSSDGHLGEVGGKASGIPKRLQAAPKATATRVRRDQAADVRNGMEFSLQQLADVTLPTNFHGRWITKRKAAVIAQIVTGRLTIEEACQRYNLSLDELSCWQRAFDRYGLSGLQATKEQKRRLKVQNH
jgi:hypothetical protein